MKLSQVDMNLESSSTTYQLYNLKKFLNISEYICYFIK